MLIRVESSPNCVYLYCYRVLAGLALQLGVQALGLLHLRG